MQEICESQELEIEHKCVELLEILNFMNVWNVNAGEGVIHKVVRNFESCQKFLNRMGNFDS